MRSRHGRTPECAHRSLMIQVRRGDVRDPEERAVPLINRDRESGSGRITDEADRRWGASGTSAGDGWSHTAVPGCRHLAWGVLSKRQSTQTSRHEYG